MTNTPSSASGSPQNPIRIKATNPADFLAALPRITGIHAPNSCFVTYLRDGLSVGAARLDLPPSQAIWYNHPFVPHWMTTVFDIAKDGDEVIISLHTDERLTKLPEVSSYGRLAAALCLASKSSSTTVKGIFVEAADGWADFTGIDTPKLNSLKDISQSKLYDPTLRNPSIDDWRKQNPGQTTELPEAEDQFDRFLEEVTNKNQ